MRRLFCFLGFVWCLSGPAMSQVGGEVDPFDCAAQLVEQDRVDAVWHERSRGTMQMEKTYFPSRADGLRIPAFIFKPLTLNRRHAALVWVHPDVRGRLYDYFVPYIREAVSRGYVVIAPEYRGSVGYGPAHFDALDYGGAEVDDVLTAAEFLKEKVPEVDPSRLGVIGWSHGGLITLLSVTREPQTLRAAAALAPVTNLFQRLARKGDDYRQFFDPEDRYLGPPSQNPALYRERSPIYQIDKLTVPLLVHVTRNDTDVEIEESMQLIDALRARKPQLAETKIYDEPPGEHLFDRLCDPLTLEPLNTREQRDSWNRVWTFLEWNLGPLESPLKLRGPAGASPGIDAGQAGRKAAGPARQESDCLCHPPGR